jgi:hypothetical protein
VERETKGAGFNGTTRPSGAQQEAKRGSNHSATRAPTPNNTSQPNPTQPNRGPGYGKAGGQAGGPRLERIHQQHGESGCDTPPKICSFRSALCSRCCGGRKGIGDGWREDEEQAGADAGGNGIARNPKPSLWMAMGLKQGMAMDGV